MSCCCSLPPSCCRGCSSYRQSYENYGWYERNYPYLYDSNEWYLPEKYNVPKLTLEKAIKEMEKLINRNHDNGYEETEKP